MRRLVAASSPHSPGIRVDAAGRFHVRKRPDATPSARYHVRVDLDPDNCYRALVARDSRFDGLFFVGVRTTRIYCRPVCRARTPAREHCVFYRRAPEAERDGFRACLRCRPELAPGEAQVDRAPRLVERAVARIEAGFLTDRRVDDLARSLGVTARHLRRTVVSELGLSPIELVQSRRLAAAKQLVRDTDLALTQVAHESGFSSLRRFNAAFRSRFREAPSSTRRRRGASKGDTESIVLRLDYRPPLDWGALLAFLGARSLPGVESVASGAYRRTIRIAGRSGWVAVRPLPRQPALEAEVSLSLSGVLIRVVGRLRALFDLDARPALVAEHLERDARLGALVRRHPGLRIPGAASGFELAVRAVVGQQVSVAGARTVAGRIARVLGAPVETPFPGLDRAFPDAPALAASSEGRIARLGMPGSRARTVLALARIVAGGTLSLEGSDDPLEALRLLAKVPGVGPWTASVIGMRALRWPDSFPSGDLGLRRAAGFERGADLERHAERWRPWRAYAAMHLWTSLGEGECR